MRFFLSQWHRNTLWGHAGNCGSYFRGELCSGWIFRAELQTQLTFYIFFFFLFPFVLFQEDFDSEQMSTLASCLAELFKSHFRGDVLPEEITEEYVSLTFSSDFLPGRLAHYLVVNTLSRDAHLERVFQPALYPDPVPPVFFPYCHVTFVHFS